MMNCKRKSGLTLTEMVLVVATIALLLGLGLPAVRALLGSFQSGTGARGMINAALASARAIAAREQRYAGIRFQKVYDPIHPDLIGVSQYMIFIVHEEPSKMGNLTIGFRAVPGVKPIKLPDAIGVTDLMYGPHLLAPAGDGIADSDVEISNVNVVRDMSAFSIIFSPSGKLVIHDVRVRNRDGKTEGTETPDQSKDDIFNTLTKISNPDNPLGMFVQDDYENLGLGKESSRNSFVIYEKDRLAEAHKRRAAWSDCLARLAVERIYINSYTGTMILPD